MLPPEVVAYYECGDEQDRLTARIGRVEWARTRDLLERHLPDPPVALIFALPRRLKHARQG